MGDINRAYAMTQAYHIPGTPEFCAAAADAICANYETTVMENCGGCCAAEIEAWQSCMLEKELSVKSKIDPPCTISSCAAVTSGGAAAAAAASDSGSGSGMGLILGIVIAIVLIFGLAAGVYVFYRKRKASSAKELDDVAGDGDATRGVDGGAK